MAEVSQAFEEQGAVVRRDERSDRFTCDLPVRRFVGFGYQRGLTLPCDIQIRHEGAETALTAWCDATGLRRSKRRLFYFWSIFFVLMSVPHLMRNGWDVWTALFMLSPWPAVEGNFLYDRSRLREKTRKSLVRVAEKGALGG